MDSGARIRQRSKDKQGATKRASASARPNVRSQDQTVVVAGRGAVDGSENVLADRATLIALQRSVGNAATQSLLMPFQRPRESGQAGGSVQVQRHDRGPLQGPDIAPDQITDARTLLNEIQGSFDAAWEPLRERAHRAARTMVTAIGDGVERVISWAGAENRELISAFSSSRAMTAVSPTVGRVVGAVMASEAVWKRNIATFGAGLILGNIFHEQREQRVEESEHMNRFITDAALEGSEVSLGLIRSHGRLLHLVGQCEGEAASMFDGRIARLRRDVDLHSSAQARGALDTALWSARYHDVFQFHEDYHALLRRFRGAVQDLEAARSNAQRARDQAVTRAMEAYAEELATGPTARRRPSLSTRRMLAMGGTGIHLEATFTRSSGGRAGRFTIRVRLAMLGEVNASRLHERTRSHLESKSIRALSRINSGAAPVKLWGLDPAGHPTAMITWTNGTASYTSRGADALTNYTKTQLAAMWREPRGATVADFVVGLIQDVPVATLATEGRGHQWD